MSTTGPTVSVVVAVRDGARYVSAALDSILGQTCPPTEVVVVDDGSRDATAEVLAAYGDPVRVVAQPPVGYGGALTRGVREARGELVAFCDADDLWAPGKQEHQLACLAEDPGCAVVGGQARQFVSPDAGDAVQRARLDLRPRAASLLGTLLVWRDQFDRVGTFDHAMRAGAAVDWVGRARRLGLRFRAVDEVVLLRRVHDDNLDAVHADAVLDGLLRALRAQRRRHRDVAEPR